MKYKLENGKEINIPDTDIKNYMKTLDLTEEEAIEMYLDDEGYTENDEVEELTKKAKDVGIKIRGESDKPRVKRVIERKEDVVKEDIIKQVAELLEGIATKVQIINIGKIIEFDMPDGEHYKFDLIRQRKQKQSK